MARRNRSIPVANLQSLNHKDNFMLFPSEEPRPASMSLLCVRFHKSGLLVMSGLILIALTCASAYSEDAKEQKAEKQEQAGPLPKKRDISPHPETRERMFHIIAPTYDKTVRRLSDDKHPPVQLRWTTLCGD